MALLISQIYAGVYLNAGDLAPLGRRRNAVIHAVAAEEIGQEKRQALVLDLVSPAGKAWSKRVPLNKTNSTQLAGAFGGDAATWPGRTIEIWSENVMYQGKLVPGIKVLPATTAPVAPAPEPALPPAGNGAAAQPPPAAAPPPATAVVMPAAAAIADDRPSVGGELDDDIPF